MRVLSDKNPIVNTRRSTPEGVLVTLKLTMNGEHQYLPFYSTKAACDRYAPKG
jgi:hypothetical protein